MSIWDTRLDDGFKFACQYFGDSDQNCGKVATRMLADSGSSDFDKAGFSWDSVSFACEDCYARVFDAS